MKKTISVPSSECKTLSKAFPSTVYCSHLLFILDKQSFLGNEEFQQTAAIVNNFTETRTDPNYTVILRKHSPKYFITITSCACSYEKLSYQNEQYNYYYHHYYFNGAR